MQYDFSRTNSTRGTSQAVGDTKANLDGSNCHVSEMTGNRQFSENNNGEIISVAVLSKTGKPLAPCHPARARELVRKKRAVGKFKKGIFYIQMLDREDGVVQDLSLGVDRGSKREGYSVLSEKRIMLNIQTEAITWVKRRIKQKRMMRKNRRQRKTPCRMNKFKRYGKNQRKTTKTWMPPSTKARWDWTLRIIKTICSLYPISDIIVEDIKAKTKKNDENTISYRWV